jgi:hypothetical protein
MRRGERTKSVKVVPARESNAATQYALVRRVKRGERCEGAARSFEQLAHTVESAWASTRQGSRCGAASWSSSVCVISGSKRGATIQWIGDALGASGDCGSAPNVQPRVVKKNPERWD